MAKFTAIAIFVCLFGVSLCVSPPTLAKNYRVTGSIRLPYAEIVEPFTAYYDVRSGVERSRVNYYNGVQSTMTLSKTSSSPYGVSFKVVPVSTQVYLNKVTCFQLNGTKEAPAVTTNVMPDLTGFKFVGTDVVNKVQANKFQLVVTEGKKVNTYSFWSSVENDFPLRYEMMGYDSLLGSHFDKYYVDYDSYVVNPVFTDQDFAPPASMSCGDFPGPGQSRHFAVELDPIREFIHHYDAHVEEGFELFKKEHNKDFKPQEHEPRKHIFRQNLRYINSKNRAGLTYRMAVNHLAAHTDAEMKAMRGYRYTHGDRGGDSFSFNMLKATGTPDQWDWRLIGAVTPVKDQAICGSCWTFGTTGAIEGANFLATGQLVRLSQQELVDCAWGFGNNGCDGGEDFRAYKYLMANGGLSSEALYRPYQGIDSICLKDKAQNVVQISNYTILPQGDLNALRLALYEKGPISVAIDASHKSFGFYANGVYYEPECSSDPDGLDHAVLAVGYGSLNGQNYWLVKNSWSTYWGNTGYILMSQKNNNCGVATAASFVQIK